MKVKSFSWNRFNSIPIIGIMRNFKQEDIENILPVYAESDLTTIEVTMNSAGALESIRYAAEKYGDQLNIGAGTVCTEEDLAAALNAGAQFIVTPIVNLQIIERCKRQGIPVFAGAYTPTEIFTAWNAGADMVKLFPIAGNGLEYIKAVKGPLPDVKLLPTGGVDLQNIASFFHAGVSGVGIGSHLFEKSLIAKKDWRGLKEHLSLFAEKIKINDYPKIRRGE
jgi:2-dehydro-3-deoxyphosphogluconate aldolase / (4S)-4-hydroxy-2-oxoglutarate aldolase